MLHFQCWSRNQFYFSVTPNASDATLAPVSYCELLALLLHDSFTVHIPGNKVKTNIQPTPLAGSLTAQESVASQHNQELESA